MSDPAFPDSARVTLAAEAEGKIVVVRGRLGQDGPEARLVVDTGAGTSALSLACAKRLSLPVQRGLHVRTPTGLTQMGVVQLPSLLVGPFEVRDVRFAAVPLPNDRVDGLLGLEFFRQLGAHTVTLVLADPPRVELTLPRR